MKLKGQSTKLIMLAVFASLMLGVASQAAAKPLKVFILAGHPGLGEKASCRCVILMTSRAKSI